MISLHPLFQDHAVLQREHWNPVWGNAGPRHRLKAEFAGKTAYSKASCSGTFKFRLPPVPAGGPFTLTVTDLDSGESISINDILVGEVWLASGQSNMEYILSGKGVSRPTAGEGIPLSEIQCQEYISSIKNDGKFRILTIPHNASCCSEEIFTGKWKNITAENAPDVSAIAAWFGGIIQDRLELPVGIIVSAWGGTPVKAWTSRAGLLSNPETENLVRCADLELGKADLWDEREASKKRAPIPEEFADSGNKGIDWGWANPDFDDSEWNLFPIPGSWIQQKAAGNGSVWFRKEITLPEDWTGKDLSLELGPVDKMDITYFNGVEIGRTGKGLDGSFWNLPRSYTVPGNLVKAGKNTLAIRAYSYMHDGAFNGKPEHYYLKESVSGEQLNIAGEWKIHSERDMGITKLPPQRIGPDNVYTPSILFDGMINPLKTYGIRGAIWYQGENNTSSITDALAYRKELAAMIRDWRYQWEQGNFPFLVMQLANYDLGKKAAYKGDSSWAVLRDQQRAVCNDLPEVYMASAVDIGEAKDIHPQNKKSAGERMAYCALHHVYRCSDIVPEGPRFAGYSQEDNAIHVTFQYADGLTLKEELPQSFYLAGADKVFYPADQIRLEGNTLVLSSGKVKEPCAVRYAWSGDPENTLYNGAGLPASPFRTDDWEIQ